MCYIQTMLGTGVWFFVFFFVIANFTSVKKIFFLNFIYAFQLVLSLLSGEYLSDTQFLALCVLQLFVVWRTSKLHSISCHVCTSALCCLENTWMTPISCHVFSSISKASLPLLSDLWTGELNILSLVGCFQYLMNLIHTHFWTFVEL